MRSGGMDTMTEGAMVEDTVEYTVVDMVATCQATAGTVVDMVMGADMVVAAEDMEDTAEDMVVAVDTVVEDMVVEATWELDTTEVGID
jgi:hypothetical protein